MRSCFRRPAALVLAACLALGACGSRGSSPLQVAVRAVALDLAFQDEELIEPVEPEVIVRVIPAPPETRQQVIDFLEAPTEPPPLPPAPVSGLCPTAPEGAAPKEAVSVTQEEPPQAGTYGRHNTGTFTVTGGVVDLTLPFPFFTRDEITDAREVAPPDVADDVEDLLGDEEPQPGAEGSGFFEWTTTHVILPDISVATVYRLTDAAIQIVERTTTNGDEVTVFRPSPAVDLIQLNEGEGHEWRSAGVDTDTNTAIQIEGRIEQREVIDVCGELIDTYRVTASEQMVDLSNGSITGTVGEDRNTYNIATQYGGLIVSTHQKYTQNSRDPESGGPIQIVYDYTSTLDSIEPEGTE